MVFDVNLKIHIENQTKAHTKKHDKKYVQHTHTHIQRNVFIFGYYYCSNGRGVHEQETDNPRDDKEKNKRTEKKRKIL
jgi:hypothetical protein